VIGPGHADKLSARRKLMAMGILERVWTYPWRDLVGRDQDRRHYGARDSFTEDQIYCVYPASIEAAAEAADRLKEGHKVVVNLERAAHEMQQRIVDFLSGVVFALEGDACRITDGVFMFVPEGVAVDLAGPGDPQHKGFSSAGPTFRPRAVS